MSLWYDIFLLLLILAGIAIGFGTGLVRQVVNLAGLYIGLVFASFYQPTIVRWFRRQFGQADTSGREIAIFFVAFGLIWLFFNIGALVAFRQRPRFLPDLADRLAGMVAGLFSAIVVGVIITLLLSYAVRVPWPDNDGLRLFLADGIRNSRLLVLFGNFIPIVGNTIEPWLPEGGLPSFFRPNFGIERR